MTKECIICCLDKEFMPGFVGLMNSFSNSPRLNDLDVVLITSDIEVYNSKELPASVRVRRLISDLDIEEFSTIKSEKIRKSEKGKTFPKDSMMKWFAYDDYGYEAALLIDTDILNLKDAGDIFDYLDDAHVVGANLFPPDLKSGKDNLEKMSETSHSLVSFLNEGWEKGRLNSGVLCFNSRLMSAEVRDGLIRIAKMEAFVNEQIVLRNWLQAHQSIKVKKISPVYNFNSYYLNELISDKGRQIRDDIKFLHFVGKNKPWRNEGVARTDFVKELWNKYSR